MRRRSTLLMVTLVLIAGGPGCGESERAGGQPEATPADIAGEGFYPDWMERSMVRLGKVAVDAVGEGFACAVATLPPNQIRIRIFATTPESLERAEALRRTLERPDRAEAALTTPRLALDTMQGIYADIQSDRPAPRPGHGSRWDVSHPEGFAFRRNDCEPITIRLQRRGAHPALERWARRAIERHGGDRVVLLHARLVDDR